MAGREYFEQVTINGITIYSGSGDPNGVLSATLSSLVIQDDAPVVWQNTDGGTTWAALGGGGGPTVAMSIQRGSLSATNETADTLQPDGFLLVYTDAYDASALARDAGGVGRTQDSDGTLNDTTYINGAISDVAGSGSIVFKSQRPIYTHRFRIDAGLADSRLFCGWSPSESSGEMSEADDPATGYLGLQFSSTRGDGTFMIAGKADGGGVQQIKDSGVVPAEGIVYRLLLNCTDDTTVTCSLYNDSTVPSTLLFSADMDTALGIPSIGFTGQIAMTASNDAVVVSFSHYYFDFALRTGVSISPV